MNKNVFILLAGVALSSHSYAQKLECRSETAGTRIVTVQGRTMTVVNPRTPNIVFSKTATSETRGNITRVTTDAWELYSKDGYGQLTNVTFGDKYTCIQTGS